MLFYLDNFRGFQNLAIGLSEVNFLVGENSTGKTSLLNAISIISDLRFWLSGDIAASQMEYVIYDDLHSANANREYFTLGIIDDKDNGSSHLISFKEDNGLPVAFREVISSGNQNILVIEASKENIHYKDVSIGGAGISTSASMDGVLKYIDSKEFKKLTGKTISLGNLKGQVLPFSAFRQVIDANDKEIHQKYQRIRNYTSFFSMNVSSLAPIRAKPLPLYSGGKQNFSPEGLHAPFLLKDILVGNRQESDVIDIINDYGKDSGLFDGLSATSYGEKRISPFELLVQRSKNQYKVSSVGYGVSQVLPLIAELLLNQSAQLISIQQPEVHLHPKAQAAFGTFLYRMALRFKKRQFVVETHSDYLIDRFRYQLRGSGHKIPSQILFFSNDGKNNTVKTIRIAEDGKYDAGDIADFRAFFIDESIKVMDI